MNARIQTLFKIFNRGDSVRFAGARLPFPAGFHGSGCPGGAAIIVGDTDEIHGTPKTVVACEACGSPSAISRSQLHAQARLIPAEILVTLIVESGTNYFDPKVDPWRDLFLEIDGAIDDPLKNLFADLSNEPELD